MHVSCSEAWSFWTAAELPSFERVSNLQQLESYSTVVREDERVCRWQLVTWSPAELMTWH